ncbi:MAG: sigma-70 family RNA polymerase sigma factor [Oceanococcus sp.]
MAAGDQAAFAQLVQRHLNDMLAFIERMTGNRADAEDICQDSFAKAWQQAAKWKPGKAKYRTWLYQVAMNQTRDRWRRQRPSEELNETIICDQATPDQAAQTAAQSQRVQIALQALPERQRGAIILNHYHGLTNIEAAEVLKISVEAVESLLGRARRTLRQQLATEMEA